MPKRDDRLLLQDILSGIVDIESFVSGFSYDSFKNDKKTIAAVVRQLEVIGEAARILSPDTQLLMPTIPWHKMRGLRNRIIHEYFNVSTEVIWFVVEHELQPLKSLIQTYLD